MSPYDQAPKTIRKIPAKMLYTLFAKVLALQTKKQSKKHIKMKKLIVLLMGLVIASLSFAQDIIVCKDSKRIDAKIIEVGQNEIKYKKFAFQDGPTFSINVNDISSIIYSNGDVAAFNSSTSQEQKVEASNPSTPVAAPKPKREVKLPSPKSKQRPIGIVIGYTQKSLSYKVVEEDLQGESTLVKRKTGLTNMILSGYTIDDNLPEKKYSNTLFLGLSWAPEFGYGFGLQTGIYYELTMEKYNAQDVYTYFANEHALSIPLRFQYRIEVAKDFSLFLYTGPSFDFGLAFNIREEEIPYPGSLIEPRVTKYNNVYKENGLHRVNVMWGVGGGLRWKGLQLRAGGDWGLINMIGPRPEIPEDKIFLHKPFHIALSYQF